MLSVIIASIIVFNAIRLLLDSVNVLMEGAPAHIDSLEVEQFLTELPGVSGVHDLHIWTLSGSTPILTAHLVLEKSISTKPILSLATRLLLERYEISHATLQIEPHDFERMSVPEPAVDGD